MRFKNWATRVLLISLIFVALIVTLLIGKSKQLESNTTTSNIETRTWNPYPQAQFQSEKNQVEKSANILKFPVKKNQAVVRYATTRDFAGYRPQYEIASVNPTNYGERYAQDINGKPLNNEPIIVLHETSDSASSAVNFFQAAHEDESIQASYHALVKLDGTVVYLVPPEKRAFGAGNSVFVGDNGRETVKTNPNLPPSVNNFAYHASLETPPDGRGNKYLKFHSGYTEAQYNSLAWLIAQSQVPDDRITTHQQVDRSGQKVDPLSFDFDKFLNFLHTYRQLNPIYRVNK